jgi:hypothetical protein
VDEDLRTGVHRNDTGVPDYFTTAYFHRPEELLEEGRAAGFAEAEVFAVEGPLWALPDFERRWGDAAGREAILRFLRTVEAEPSLRGASPHLLLAARKPGG